MSGTPSWDKITSPFGSTTTQFGGNWGNLISDYFNGVNIALIDASKAPLIGTLTRYRFEKLALFDVDESHYVSFSVDDIDTGANRKIRIRRMNSPYTEDFAVLENMTQTMRGKSIVDNLSFTGNIPPSVPPSGKGVLWFNSNNKHFYQIDDTGVLYDLTLGSGAVGGGSSGGGYATTGSALKSGDGTTTVFTITHNISAYTPTRVFISARSSDALGPFSATIDATNITITFPIAPPVGTSNLDFYWLATDSTFSGGSGSSGEANVLGSVGTGEGTLPGTKSGVTLNMKSLKQGTNITLTNNANDVTISASGSVGEANTTSTAGTGEGTLTLTKSGVNLPFKSLKQGTNITLTNNANDVTITAASGSGAPTSSQYITLATDATLTNERVLTNGLGLSLTDGGAGSTATLAYVPTGLISGWTILQTDFLENVSTPIFDDFGSGVASGVFTDSSETNALGVWTLYTGTDTTGRMALLSNDNGFKLGGSTLTLIARVRLPVLSVLAQRYIARIGFGDTASGENVDGVYFEYDESTSANWRIVTANNSTRTKATSSTAVPADTWVWLKIIVNSAGTSASFYVNGTEVANSPIATNLPASTRTFGMMMSIIKSAGTTGMDMDVDYIGSFAQYSSSRGTF